MNRFCETGVEVEELGPVIDVRNDDDLLLDRGVAENRVVDSNAGKIVVSLVFGFDEGVGNIWDWTSVVC